ncbi:ROK family transcriptional regulator [Gracilibacillus sp. YIM 98692]|uniref:ROK family transcriptional regulator n=1 Tax=Gracilibacillus sp. YIM 98692 TaxID=2663532 RepID=UPI0013D695B3|nr:ROK family transcriptional regulator [Gracilibacillus sp. YIM 98692]
MKVLRNGSKELIKEINRFKVLNMIRKKHPISRSEISQEYNLGASTLKYIIEDLTNVGYITEVGESSSTGGRRAKLLEFNKDYGYTASVKIEEKQILIALTNMEAEIMDSCAVTFEKQLLPEAIVDIIEKHIHHLLKINNVEREKLLGIGVLSSGLVNRKHGIIIRSSMLGWKNAPITKMLKQRFDQVRVYVDNNINGYTLAELWNGLGKEYNNFLVVSVGAGLGLSVVIDRQIYYGAVGGAGEFGHTTIEVDGYPCHCGQKGCLEMYASEFYFENKGSELLPQFPNTKIKDFSFNEVAAKAKEGDPLAVQLFKQMSKYLGYGLRNLINTFNPEQIILAGEGMRFNELFWDDVKRMTESNFFSKVGIDTNVVKSRLDDTSWLIGGALLAIDQIFQEPIYEKEKVTK